MADDLSSTLEEIRERRNGAECVGLWRPTPDELDLSYDDIPRLTAAIEAVLELAGNANPILSGFSDMSVIGFTLDPKAIREAISRELTKGESDA